MVDSCTYLSRIECSYVGSTIVTVYKKVFENVTGDSKKDKPTIVGFSGSALSSDLNPNIFDNFQALQNKHSEVFSKVERIETDFVSTIGGIKTAADAKAARLALRGKIKDIQKTLYQSSFYDSIFLGMLQDTGSQLISITGTATRIVSDANCQVLKDPLNRVSDNALTFFQRIDELRKYVGLASYKRGQLLEKFNRSMELAIYRAQANAEGKDLDQLLADLGSVFTLDAALWDVTDWWLQASTNGLAGRLHTKYLQYRRPLQILSSEIGKAEALKDRINKISGIDDKVRASSLAIVDDHVKDIQSNIDLILKRGWAGSLEVQKQSATKRIALIPASNVLCHQVTDSFFALAAKAVEIESYELAEAKFNEHVDVCVKG